ncbi:MAG: hypothetical protein JWO47_949 [Candidatus Saccharibacteria bacterium]|nr:hypothetical protein [Candidatus Saccharibacteria bacterium]
MNDTDIQQLTSLLRKLKPGFLPFDIFIEIARLTVLPIIEFVPLRMYDGKVEVLLLPRSQDDKFWPGQLHTPGTVIRATDTDEGRHTAFGRITKNELKDTAIGEPHYVGSSLNKSKRGMEQILIFWVEVKSEPRAGSFYKASQLPELLMESQRGFISQALKSYFDFKAQV